MTGTIAYLDDEAQTYMVRALDGELIRVPLRDMRETLERRKGVRPQDAPAALADV